MSALKVAKGSKAPTEIRLFAFGENETHNGTYLVDEDSRKLVVENFEKYGLPRLAIDFDHKSMSSDGPADAGKAAGSFVPEVRDDGIWATDIQWTETARAAIEAGEWLYYSGGFEVDDDNRVISVLNFALTNFPATFGLQPLAARDRRKLSAGVSFFDLQRILGDALSERFAGDGCGGCWPVDVFDATLVFEREGKLWEVTYAFDGATVTLGDTATEVQRAYVAVETPAPPAPAPAAARKTTAALAAGGDDVTAEQMAALAEALGLGTDATFEDVLATLQAIVQKAKDAANGTGSEPAADAPAGDEVAAETKAATAKLARLTGKASLGESVREVETWRTSHVELAAERAKVAKDRAALEAGERRTLVAQLVKLSIEIPATAWEPDADGVPTQTPCKRLAAEPIDELRDRVAKLSAARGGRELGDGGPKPPTGAGAHGLSERELTMCRDRNVDPAVYAAKKAALAARTVRNAPAVPGAQGG